MKKANLFLMIAMLVLMNGLAFAGRMNISESLSNGQTAEGYKSIRLELKGQQVNNASSISWKLENIGGMNAMHVSVETVSSGNATTVNAQQTMSDSTISIGTARVITEGTAFTDIEGDYYTITFYNNVAVTTNVTLNFMVSD